MVEAEKLNVARRSNRTWRALADVATDCQDAWRKRYAHDSARAAVEPTDAASHSTRQLSLSCRFGIAGLVRSPLNPLRRSWCQALPARASPSNQARLLLNDASLSDLHGADGNPLLLQRLLIGSARRPPTPKPPRELARRLSRPKPPPGSE